MTRSKEHEALIRKMGMSMGMNFDELLDSPTDMSLPNIVERMTQVIKTTEKTPSQLDKLNDFDLGNVVRMLIRSDYYHEEACVAARNRIWKLSKSLEVAQALSGVDVEQINHFLGITVELAQAYDALENATKSFKDKKCTKQALAAKEAANRIKAFLEK